MARARRRWRPSVGPTQTGGSCCCCAWSYRLYDPAQGPRQSGRRDVGNHCRVPRLSSGLYERRGLAAGAAGCAEGERG
eukprot:6986409-Alexandrium_andersonii.AAC.1